MNPRIVVSTSELTATIIKECTKTNKSLKIDAQCYRLQVFNALCPVTNFSKKLIQLLSPKIKFRVVESNVNILYDIPTTFKPIFSKIQETKFERQKLLRN